ncbi:Tryp_alpha_amyl domain-containing protein, partial [Cephalotus follicularis]
RNWLTKMKGVIIAVIMVWLMVEPGQAAISCSQVESSLAPCLPYLTLAQRGAPSATCCTGVRNIKTMTLTTPDRRAACECVKTAASRYRGIKPDAASQLPKQCGVDIGIPITKDVDCNR